MSGKEKVRAQVLSRPEASPRWAAEVSADAPGNRIPIPALACCQSVPSGKLPHNRPQLLRPDASTLSAMAYMVPTAISTASQGLMGFYLAGRCYIHRCMQHFERGKGRGNASELSSQLSRQLREQVPKLLVCRAGCFYRLWYDRNISDMFHKQVVSSLAVYKLLHDLA